MQSHKNNFWTLSQTTPMQDLPSEQNNKENNNIKEYNVYHLPPCEPHQFLFTMISIFLKKINIIRQKLNIDS